MFALIVKILLGAIGIFWGGYVTAHLWAWFAVPLGAPAITWVHAVGLGLLVVALAGPKNDLSTGDTDLEKIMSGLIISLVGPAVLLLSGYIAHSYMV